MRFAAERFDGTVARSWFLVLAASLASREVNPDDTLSRFFALPGRPDYSTTISRVVL